MDLNKIDVGSVYIHSTCDNTCVGTISQVDALGSRLDELTRKPEVREDQRSALEVRTRVVAKYYKNGFYTHSKDIIPAIKSIDVFNENTIKMTFVNGHVQTATVQNGDPYFFEDGLLRCIVKEMIGQEGTAILSKLLSYATNFYNNAEAEKKKKAQEEEDKRVAAENHHRKARRRWEKQKKKERENRIKEMAEAIKLANTYKLN